MPSRPRTRRPGFAGASLLLGWMAAAGVANAGPVIVDPGQGAVDVERNRTGATGLSGLTHLAGSRFLAVSDRTTRLFSLDVELDSATGRIASVTLQAVSRLQSARDTEGIAATGRGTVWVCDETGPAVREHRIEDGSVVRTLRLPPVFAQARSNLSLEGLARGPAGEIWIANEEALSVDGPKSTPERGTVVRIQRLDASAKPNGQWAYVTDPVPGNPMGKFTRSGVVDLLALPDGELLVLERGLGSRGLRSRIYRVDRTSATDTSKLGALVGADYRPVAKEKLWEGTALGDNFEGLALGDASESGSYPLLLLSDDGGATLPRLYPLRLRMDARL